MVCKLGTEGLSSKPPTYRSYRSKKLFKDVRHSTEQTVRANGKKGCDVEESVFAYNELAQTAIKVLIYGYRQHAEALIACVQNF